MIFIFQVLNIFCYFICPQESVAPILSLILTRQTKGNRLFDRGHFLLAFVSLHMIKPTRNERSVFVNESVLGIIFYKIIPAPSGIVGGHIPPGVISKLYNGRGNVSYNNVYCQY